jgi:hypothetical protein
MTDLSFRFHGFHPILLLPLFVVLIAYLYFALKNRNLLTSFIGKTIIILRLMLLLSFLLLAFQPEIKWLARRVVPPKVIIAVDNSRSMSAQNGFNRDSLLLYLDSVERQLNTMKIEPIRLVFTNQVQIQRDNYHDLQFDGAATDISAVLNFLQDQNPADNLIGAILISDGIATLGEDPLIMDIHLAYPLYTLGIGDTTQIHDPRIVSVDLPLQTKVGDTVKVLTEYVPFGDGKPLSLQLVVDGQLKQQLSLVSQPVELNRAASMNLIFTEPGIHQVSLIMKAEQDINPINNQIDRQIRVNAALFNVGIIDGSGSFEHKFLNYIISQQSIYKVSNLIQVPRTDLNQFLKRRYDALLLIGFPNIHTDNATMADLRRKIAAEHLPLWLWVNDQSDLKKIEVLLGEQVFLEAIHNRNPEPITLNSKAIDWTDELLQSIQRYSGDVHHLTNLPPIGAPFKKLKLAPDWQTMLSGNPPAEIPLMARRAVGQTHQLISIGCDFWRWHLMMGAENDFYSELIKHSLVWLADTLSRSRLIFNLEREVFLTGEVINLKAQCFDLVGKPLPQAEVVARLSLPDGKTKQLPLSWMGNAFTVSYLCEQAGDYKIAIKAKMPAAEYITPECSFRVTEQPIELLKVRQNYQLLKWLSHSNHGRLLSLPDLKALPQLFKGAEKIVCIERNIKAWRSPFIIALLLGMLCLEWLIRRRYGFQ